MQLSDVLLFTNVFPGSIYFPPPPSGSLACRWGDEMNRIQFNIFFILLSLFFVCPAWTKDAPSKEELLKIYNTGQAAQKDGNHEAALNHFLTVKKHVPDDWRTRAKIIQE